MENNSIHAELSKKVTHNRARLECRDEINLQRFLLVGKEDDESWDDSNNGDSVSSDVDISSPLLDFNYGRGAVAVVCPFHKSIGIPRTISLTVLLCCHYGVSNEKSSQLEACHRIQKMESTGLSG